MRVVFFGFLLAIFCFSEAAAQGDSLSRQNKPALNPVDPKTVNPFLPDSLVKANRQQFTADSVASNYLMPDSARMRSGALDSILKLTASTTLFQQKEPVKAAVSGRTGTPRIPREKWVIVMIVCMLIYVGLLNLFFSSDLKGIIQSFYNKRSLSQTDKEAGLINSWAFAGLLLLFCLAVGLVLYQLTIYYKKVYPLGGFELFLALAGVAGMLITLKFLVLKVIGFIFDIGAVISGYLAVLNLTYFSLGFVFLGAGLCFSLLANQFVPQLLAITAGLTAIIFIWQYLLNGLNIISDFRFHKFYLFVYLCALEICPVLVLIKALNI